MTGGVVLCGGVSGPSAVRVWSGVRIPSDRALLP